MFDIEHKSCFIIAEAGSNWKSGTYDQDMERTEKLIKKAKESGADAIKFQTYSSKTVYVDDAGTSDYLSDIGIKEKINELFDNFSMPHKMIPEISKMCRNEDIMFMSTPFSIDDAVAIDPFVKIHKIASYEINHVRLLEFIAKTGKPVILSTGACDYDDIEFGIKCLQDNGCKDITLLQCTSAYPCEIKSLNLKVIPELIKKYGFSVGLSDHSEDPTLAPTLAVTLGAKVIEKHFTLNKELQGPDHKFALEPNELKLMINSIRNAEKAQGDGNKRVLDVEQELKQFASRSIQTIKDIKKGEELIENYNFQVLRPGKRKRGLSAKNLLMLNNKHAISDIKKGDGITDFY